ncbi:uncharacterized protein TNCV_3999321 [Trichonephila clavipes]|nr:uncharacterized protein TNCV_3999321 [Trichonephila clavipes]
MATSTNKTAAFAVKLIHKLCRNTVTSRKTDCLELWFQQDGATCHTARATIDLLKDTLGDRLISRFGSVNWPPRSCDLTPLDCFLWGYVKSLVYADKPQTLDHLEDNIRRVIADIRPQMLEKVIENWTSRLDYYIRASRGSPMPEIIFKICNQSTLKLEFGHKYGFSHQLKLVCKTCSEQKMECFTSPRLEKKTNTSTPFDVNVRAVQAFLAISGGHASVEKFCMFLNMPLMSSKTFNEIKCYINSAYSLASQTVLNYVHNSVQNAYRKLDQNGSNTITDIAVSFDGTWLTRGHTSQIGIGCVVDTLTGYVIDYEIMSKYCPTCISAKNELGETTAEYDVWYSGHKNSCQINHVGTSGAMEMKAAAKIWSRSEACGFRYTTLLSDGTSLRNLVKDWRAKGITLGGKSYGSLKETTIKKLTQYYQKAILENKGDIQGMKKSIYATLYHSISTDKNPMHMKCPPGKDSWCFYRRALAKGEKPAPHKFNIGTPINPDYLTKIVPIYQRLASDSLLKGCARCLTQNSNEFA